MKKKNRKNNKAGIITVGGNFTLPGQKRPNVIVLTQPKRFGLDISDYMAAVKAAENVDFSRRYKLYDLYEDILMDTHLSCVLEKRRNAVLCSNMEFRVDGKPDDKINEQIQSPWFNRLVGDILDAKFWGFSLCQFYKLQEWVDYDLVPRKHVDPVRELILRHQTDITGHSWNEYTDLLFVGSPSDLGLLAKAAPWVIYKRNTTGDWAQFSEVFGMPIQEYIYDSDDDNDGYIQSMNSPLNTYILRLADVYLTYAEACLGNSEELAGGPGLEALNQVRDRARIPRKERVTFEDIIRERRVEFSMEYCNWYDMVSWYHWKPDYMLNYFQNQHRGYTVDLIVKDEDGYLHFGKKEGDTFLEGIENWQEPGENIEIHHGNILMPYPESDVIQNPLLNEEPVAYEFSE